MREDVEEARLAEAMIVVHESHEHGDDDGDDHQGYYKDTDVEEDS